MKYAEVAVDSRIPNKQTYSYSIPSGMAVEPGQLVWVPFGSGVVQGIIFRLVNDPQVESTRDILQPIEPTPLIRPHILQLAEWISQYYLCSLFSALSHFLPHGIKTQVQRIVHPGKNFDPNIFTDDEDISSALSELSKHPIRESHFKNMLGQNSLTHIRRMLNNSVISIEHRLTRGRSFKYTSYLSSYNQLIPENQKLSDKQSKLLEAIRSSDSHYPLSLANKEFGNGVGLALIKKGLISQEWIRDVSNPDNYSEPSTPNAITLTSSQNSALNRILDSVNDPHTTGIFLLHGVTGSGKTEVYLRAIEQVIQQGKQALYLVPEIRLTPQTVSRVQNKFKDRVAVIHSQLTPRERFNLWWDIHDGMYDVVVGPRSALFTPVAHLGIIVIDEEHEWTYKQTDTTPYYHARTVAIEYAAMSGATVILGSATPSIESYQNALSKSYTLLELPDRIESKSFTSPNTTAGKTGELAEALICDMREELKSGNRSIFSRKLSEELEGCLSRKEQAILFINRRGNSPIVQCRDCGHVMECSSCSVTLAFHSEPQYLLCHLCNRKRNNPNTCPKCRSANIRQLGIGTQRIVEELHKLFPNTKIDRWDSDSQKSTASSNESMRSLETGSTQILVGTQVVAKGLDIPNVTLVGAILADIGLHLPDFRSSERTFDILCQLAGRAGRGYQRGKVIIQTYSPTEWPIVAAAKQDYGAMFQNEISERETQKNPPFNDLIHLVYRDTNLTTVEQNTHIMLKTLRRRLSEEGRTDIELIGPAPGFPSRIRGKHRWHIILRGRNLHSFVEAIHFPSNWTVDVDPSSVM